MKKLLLGLILLTGCHKQTISTTNRSIEATLGCLAHEEFSYMITSKEGENIGGVWGSIQANKNYTLCSEFIKIHPEYWCKQVKVLSTNVCPQ